MESAAPLRPPLFAAQLPPSTPGKRRIERVCIANRGEIACRIIATCRKLSLISIAIYVDEDARSRHVSEADESICLGSISQDGGNPFLNVKLLVETALSAKVDAIHPGYGYLSENQAFADAVRQAGMIFVGPSSQAIATLGDKRQSKEYLKKHAPNIPLVPGFAGSSQNAEDLQAAAEVIGYPVMLKASAGGGGRGIRIVRDPAKLKEDLERAQSEAKRSFGSTDCILEK
jgi:acetyl/propionyl-CoA carboxylase alpha subunit